MRILWIEDDPDISEKEFNTNGVWKRQQVSEAFNTKLKMKIIKDAESLAL